MTHYMKPKNRLLLFLILISIFYTAPLRAASVEDLLDVQRLSKHLKTTAMQQPFTDQAVALLQTTIADYQTEYAKRTCEAALWQGHIPHVKDLRTLRKTTRDSVDAIINTLKTHLDDKQKELVDKILKGKDNILDYPVAQTPFYRVNNSPLFREFSSKTTAYALTLPGQPDTDDWTYAQLLKVWTTRGYIPSMRPIDDVQQAPGIVDQPDLQTRVLPAPERARIIQSPLIVAATILVPDLGQAEFNLLQSHYGADSVDVRTWQDYTEQNRLDDAIQVRLKLNTPYNKAYLDLSRWIIYLEDDDGTGYEPKSITERAYYPLEAVKVSVPGQEIEITDVFGNYISPIPGDKERFYLEAPQKITYVGNEKLLQLFFPGRDFQGNPVVTPKTQFLKFIIQSQETDFGRCELYWDLKRPKSKVRPAKE